MIPQPPVPPDTTDVSLGTLLRGLWIHDPEGVLRSLQDQADLLPTLAWADWFACWCDALEVTNGTDQAWPVAQCLLGALPAELIHAYALAQACRSAPGWGVAMSRYSAGHQTRAWGFMERFFGPIHPELLDDVAAHLAGEALLEDGGVPNETFARFLSRLGPDARVGPHRDTPWVLLWANWATDIESDVLREAALDQVLAAGADLDAVGPDGRRALAHVREPQLTWRFSGRLTKKDSLRLVEQALGLLLDRGAAWEDMKQVLPAAHWTMIGRHAVGKRARLVHLAAKQGKARAHADDSETAREL